MNNAGITAPRPGLSEFQPHPAAPELFSHAVIRPHSIGLSGSPVRSGAPVPCTARQQQRQRRRHYQCRQPQPPEQSRTPNPPTTNASEHARKIQSVIDILRLHDPREVIPRPFIEIMIKAAIRDGEIAADIKKLAVQKPLHPKAQCQAQAVSVSHFQAAKLYANGLPYPQLGHQRPLDGVSCGMPPPTAPPITPLSHSKYPPSQQHLPQLHTMSHSQTALQHQTTPHSVPQPVPQPTTESEPSTMTSGDPMNPTS